jgi:uncharacterized SAM-dependent methyltransferase
MFALRHSMGPVRLTVHTGMSIANAGPTRRRWSFLAAHGGTLAPGDRIIAGSLIAPLPIEPGDQLEVEFGTLGRLTARFS